MTGYLRPVEPVGGRMSSWAAHTNRGTPSTEPGTDYYVPVGTPVRAAAGGRVVDTGDSIRPATGRFVTIDLDDGRRVRYLHLKRRHVSVGTRVKRGQHIADSGATGYGEEDWSWNVAGMGGAHVHMTLWAHQRYTFGRYATLDPERYMASKQAAKPKPKPKPKPDPLEDDMAIIIAQRKNPDLAKGRMVGKGKIELITRHENTVFRAAQQENRDAVIYVTVSDATFTALQKGSK